MIKYVPDSLKSNRTLLKLAIQKNVNNYQYVPLNLIRSKEFNLELVFLRANVYFLLPRDLKMDKEIIRDSIQKSCLIYNYIPFCLRKSMKFHLELLEYNKECYEYFPLDIKEKITNRNNLIYLLLHESPIKQNLFGTNDIVYIIRDFLY